MKAEDPDAWETALAEYLAQYDESLASDTPAQIPHVSSVSWDKEQLAECDRAKECLELIDRVRRQWTPTGVGAGHDDQSAPPSRSAPSLAVTIGRFQVERELGRGGLGVVHLAFDPNLGRQVALKIPRFELLVNDDLRRRFLREAEAAARLSHPNLVTVFEAGEDGTICYLTSEYCEGPNLAQWLQSAADPVAPRLAALTVRRLALAVQHAHGRGVLHRDIKPSNILLDATSDDELPWQPKLADFGMAKLLERQGDETRTGAMIGTPAYMAPEQAEGRVRDLDARTDVYALGAVLYEMLTRQAPAFGETDLESLRKVLCEEPVALRTLRSDVPRDLEAICLKCLARRQESRYTTAQELANDLQRFLDGRPTEARPLSALGAVFKWGRRRPTAAAIVALLIVGGVLLATGAAAYTLRIRRHAEELSQALAAKDEATATARSHADATARAYPSDVRLAQQAWKEGRVADAKVLLAKHLPRAADMDHRSFAWHFLSRLCEVENKTLAGHGGPVYVCRYSPDGQWLATAGEEGQLRLWNATSDSLARAWQAHDREIDGLSFSPDGKWLATTAGDQGAAVWEATTGSLVHRLDNPEGVILAAAFTPNGQTLVVGGDAGIVSLLNTADWSTRAEFADIPQPIQLLALSHDGTVLATTSTDTTIRLWQLPEMTPLATLEGHTRDITALVFAHHQTLLASSSRDGTVKLWRPATRRALATYEAKTDYVHDVAFAPDDCRLVLAGHLGDVQAWDLTTDKCEFVLQAGTVPVYSVAVSSTDRHVAAATADELVHVWHESVDPEKKRLVTSVPGRAVAVSPDSRMAAIGDFEGNIRYYDLATGDLLNQMAAHASRIDAICFSEEGDLQAVGFEDGTIRLSHLHDLAPAHLLAGHSSRIWTISISSDGRLLASCSNDRTVRIWDTSRGQELQKFSTTDDMPQGTAFSPDGQFLACPYRRGSVCVWRVADGVKVATLSGHDGDVLCVAWSPDGKLLASGAANNTICLWDMEQRALVSRFVTGQEAVSGIVFSPDGRTLATGSDQGKVKLWDIASQEELLQLTGHRGIVDRVFFSPQGDTLFSFAPGKQCELFRWSRQ